MSQKTLFSALALSALFGFPSSLWAPGFEDIESYECFSSRSATLSSASVCSRSTTSPSASLSSRSATPDSASLSSRSAPLPSKSIPFDFVSPRLEPVGALPVSSPTAAAKKEADLAAPTPRLEEDPAVIIKLEKIAESIEAAEDAKKEAALRKVPASKRSSAKVRVRVIR